jgi:putative hemolysin
MIQTGTSQEISTNKSRLYTSIARNASEIAESQRLRFKVFGEEMGAQIRGPEGLDVDEFDQFCEHLLVRESETHKVIGSYRILSPQNAKKAGGYYSANEFDLSRISHLFDRTVEVGRACVHQDYRNGGTITMLWGGLAKYMLKNNYEYMIGCGSVSMLDGGHTAASLYAKLKEKHLSPPEYRVFPHNPVPLAALNSQLETEIPPLIKGYLRVGAYICGEPAWDANFNTADMLVMLPLSRINKRYADHFLK